MSIGIEIDAQSTLMRAIETQKSFVLYDAENALKNGLLDSLSSVASALKIYDLRNASTAMPTALGEGDYNCIVLPADADSKIFAVLDAGIENSARVVLICAGSLPNAAPIARLGTKLSAVAGLSAPSIDEEKNAHSTLRFGQ